MAAAVATFVGFAPTYYLKAVYGMPPLPPLVHLHGIVFTLWIVLLIIQTSMVALKRTDLHRRLGIVGAVLAVVMTVVGPATAIAAVQRGRMDARFLIVPMSTVVVFPVLVGAALLMRRRAEAHKRLMVIATTELLTAAMGRWPGVRDWGAFGSYAVTDLFLIALLIYDLVTRRRLHPATIWGGLFLVASQFSRETVRNTATWLAMAGWLTS